MSLGICFSGGGIKGAAHIGVLKAFEEESIDFKYISGTSSGSIVASLYAMGYCSDEIKEIFRENLKKIKYIEFKKLVKLIYGIIVKRRIIIDGLNSGNKIEKIINKYSESKNIYNINEIKKCILIPSIDVDTGITYYFSSIKHANNRGFSDKIIYVDDISVGKAVHASCSYPGIFSPCMYKNVKLTDGGIRENTPWKEVKKNGVSQVICVTFVENSNVKKEKGIFDIVENSIKIMSHELANYELKGVDFLIKIELKEVGLLEIEKFNYLYKLGYNAGKKFILENKDKIIKK